MNARGMMGVTMSVMEILVYSNSHAGMQLTDKLDIFSRGRGFGTDSERVLQVILRGKV